MLIGIDGNEANVERRVGISEYVFELLRQFSDLRLKIKDLRFVIYLKTDPREDMPEEDENWQYRIVGPKKMWTQIGLPIDLFFHRPRPDVFFSPTHYAPRFSPIPCTISIMDVSYLRFPLLFRKSDFYQLKNWTAYSVKKAAKIFTISESSKSDIMKAYGVPQEKVVVTYPGIKVKSTMQISDVLKEKYGIDKKYFLFVGTLQPRKNLSRLIEAFARLIKEEKQGDLSLVIVGKKGWMYEDILKAPQKYRVERQVQFIDFVPDGDLSLLYKNAICLVFPSLYEGFGLPILEAMAHGCPVITSNVSSLPEAGEEAVLYVNPESVDDIYEKTKRMLSDETLRGDLQKKGYEQVKKFSWEKAAQETLNALMGIAQQKT